MTGLHQPTDLMRNHNPKRVSYPPPSPFRGSLPGRVLDCYKNCRCNRNKEWIPKVPRYLGMKPSFFYAPRPTTPPPLPYY